MIYLISYDLNKPGKDYSKLYDKLKTFKYCHPLESTWIIQTNKSVNDLYDIIKGTVDDNDYFIIVDITGKSKHGWLKKTATECINNL